MEEKRDVTGEAGDEKQTRDFLQSEAIGEKGTDQNSKKRSITAGATADHNHPPLIATWCLVIPKYIKEKRTRGPSLIARRGGNG